MKKNLFTVEVKTNCDHDTNDHKHPGLFSTTVRGIEVDGEDEGQYLHREDTLRVIKHVLQGYREMYEATGDPIYILGGNMVGAVGALLDVNTVPERATALNDTLPDDLAIPADWMNISGDTDQS